MCDHELPFGVGLRRLLDSDTIENLLDCSRSGRAGVFEACALSVSEQIFAISSLNIEIHAYQQKETHYET